MAKESGLGFTVEVDDATPTLRDISNDVTNFEFGTPLAVQDVTGVDVTAMERLLLLADFSVELNGVFNDEANKSHSVLRTVPSTRVQRTVSLSLSGQVLSNECLFTDYSFERSEDGSFVWTAPAQLADGTAPTWATS